MEKNLHDALNVGLGLFQTAQGTFDKLQKDIVSSFEDLVARGAADKSEAAERIRGVVDGGFNAVRDLQSKAEETKTKAAPKAKTA